MNSRKVSISLPEDLLKFVDQQGKNRSHMITLIIRAYQEEETKKELSRAYEAYQELYEESDKDWESASISDISKPM